MNEVNPQHLNFNNYYQIALWENKNDSVVQMLSNKKDYNNSLNKSYIELIKSLNSYK